MILRVNSSSSGRAVEGRTSRILTTATATVTVAATRTVDAAARGEIVDAVLVVVGQGRIQHEDDDKYESHPPKKERRRNIDIYQGMARIICYHRIIISSFLLLRRDGSYVLF